MRMDKKMLYALLYLMLCIVSLGLYYYFSYFDPQKKGVKAGGFMVVFYCCTPFLLAKNKLAGLIYIVLLTLLFVFAYFTGFCQYAFYSKS